MSNVKILTVDQVVSAIKVPKRVVLQLIESGKMKSWKNGAGHYRVARSEMKKFRSKP